MVGRACATAAVVCHLECDKDKVNARSGEGWRCGRIGYLATATRRKFAVDALRI